MSKVLTEKHLRNKDLLIESKPSHLFCNQVEYPLHNSNSLSVNAAEVKNFKSLDNDKLSNRRLRLIMSVFYQLRKQSR